MQCVYIHTRIYVLRYVIIYIYVHTYIYIHIGRYIYHTDRDRVHVGLGAHLHVHMAMPPDPKDCAECQKSIELLRHSAPLATHPHVPIGGIGPEYARNV